MEMVVGVERRLEGLSDDVSANNSGVPPLKHGADPIVYKLVRVDFDGRFIPATDDEVVEVENLLELENNGILPIQGHDLDRNDKLDKPLLEKHEGLSQFKLIEGDGKIARAHVEDSLPTSTSSSEDRHMKRSGNSREQSNSSLGAGLNKVDGYQPNFSLIKGEINLDNLTVRELHETFRATFGRETSVKDKVWLKRRIAMGLKNSCDVSEAGFVINDERLMKEKEEHGRKMDCEDSVAGEIDIDVDNGPVNSNSSPNLKEHVVDETDLKESFTEFGCKSGDNFENRLAKRVRKPTKRYIEELSDIERYTGGKSMASSKRFEEDKASPRILNKPAGGTHSGDFVTRSNSIGGSGIQVPYDSRIRKYHPRKSIMDLMNFDSEDAALARKVVERSVEVSDPLLKRVKAEPKEVSQEAIASEETEEKLCLSSLSDVSQSREQKSMDSEENTPDNTSGNSSDDRVATVPAANEGTRRKHHRAWSLTEVTKLVDGVAKFGAGRWSEIKRLSFSSCPHRTPVDLKDKWRNLLKASYTNSQADKGINVRKNLPLPIPASILVGVKELAELNGQAPPIKASSNNSGSSVNENRSGCL